ncbi:IS256 family transposase, partial [Acinetobacter baumannii]
MYKRGVPGLGRRYPVDQDTLQVMLREAVRQTVTEVLQILLDA